jgi:hypothetical protein
VEEERDRMVSALFCLSPRVLHVSGFIIMRACLKDLNQWLLQTNKQEQQQKHTCHWIPMNMYMIMIYNLRNDLRIKTARKEKSVNLIKEYV